MSRAPRNRTLTLSPAERRRYAARVRRLAGPAGLADVIDTTICQDAFEALHWLPPHSVDLLFADPPYLGTRARSRGGANYGMAAIECASLPVTSRRSDPFLCPASGHPAGDVWAYAGWLDNWLALAQPLLKRTASLYVCCDWRSSAVVQAALERRFVVRNRITWEREKGRAAAANWKSSAEDIWFATVSDEYTFNAAAVRLCRAVRAPYTDAAGRPKDWSQRDGRRVRLTAASNLWTDLTVPFWSMPENTVHPTQKPEKLLAKMILASTNAGELVLDPFLGSGTTSVVARKLGRRFIGVELDEEFACIAEKRLARASADARIQGYADGIFWERNSGPPALSQTGPGG